jgi:hypothetical protein
MSHDSTIPADLLALKARFDLWRAHRKYVREPIPDELRQAAAEMSVNLRQKCMTSRTCVDKIKVTTLRKIW